MNWGEQALMWPNRAASRIVTCRPHRWHLQEMGPAGAPRLLLLHGAGSATHTWRDVLPLLAQDYRCVALDLPGQGFTRMGTRNRSGLATTSADIVTLAAQEGWDIDVVIGHSAGAALALQLARDMPTPPAAMIGINAALEKFPGPAEWAFPIAARLLSLNPLTASAFAATISSNASVRTLIESTGSHLDDRGLALYRAVISDRGHVDAALNMMAQWSLDGLLAALPDLTLPCLLLTGDGDKAVPPATSTRAAARLPHASVQSLPGLGHLAHEEDPELIVRLIRTYLAALDPPLTRAA